MSREQEIVQKIVDGAARVLPAPADGVILTQATSIKVEAVRWLWLHWLAQGKVHLLAGPPGQGKTMLALAMASTVSSGGKWPDGSHCAAGNVLIWSGEDDPGDTLVPRLMGMRADLSRVHFIQSARIDGEVVPFDPVRDMPGVQAAAEAVGNVRLLIVDPIVSAVAGDSHKNSEVRKGMQPLVDLAAATRCAVIGITHLSKGTAGRDPTERVTGSIGFTAVVRVVLLASKVKDDDGRDKRILVRSKSNIGPDSGGFEYHVEQAEAAPGIETSIVTWGAAVEGTARELLADAEADPDEGEGDDACEMLFAELTAGGWTPADEASKPLRAAGFTKKQIWAASKRAGVIRKKGGLREGWYWRLPGNGPEDSAEDSEGSTQFEKESWESSGRLESSGTAEGVQKTSKVSTQKNGHLRKNLDTFDDAEAEDIPFRETDL